MSRTTHCLYTQSQLLHLFIAWKCTEPLPKRGQQVIIAWPGKAEFEADIATAELTSIKGTYGDRLYRVTMSSRAGRAFDESVQEAHVLAFAGHLAEQRRAQNLARNAAFLQ